MRVKYLHNTEFILKSYMSCTPVNILLATGNTMNNLDFFLNIMLIFET